MKGTTELSHPLTQAHTGWASDSYTMEACAFQLVSLVSQVFLFASRTFFTLTWEVFLWKLPSFRRWMRLYPLTGTGALFCVFAHWRDAANVLAFYSDENKKVHPISIPRFYIPGLLFFLNNQVLSRSQTNLNTSGEQQHIFYCNVFFIQQKLSENAEAEKTNQILLVSSL